MISQQQINDYHDQGYLLVESYFTAEEVELMNSELTLLMQDNGPRKVIESNGEIRSYYGAHQMSDIYRDVCRVKKLVEPVRQILDSEIYIHQTKINFKKALKGNWWEWHQDFPYWNLEDGMPLPRVTSVMIYLDDVTEFNGPLMVIPGSHKLGIVSFEDKQESAEEVTATGANLKYTIGRSVLKQGFEDNNVVSTIGKAGSVLFFHGNIFHASNCNMSPFDRRTYIITYNSVENTLNKVEKERPEYLSERDCTPLQTLENEWYKKAEPETIHEPTSYAQAENDKLYESLN